MTKSIDMFIVYNLRPTYHELGEYEFKVVLSPDKFKNSHDSDIVVLDSDGGRIATTVQKWGRKINCVMSIGCEVPDGVATAKMALRLKDGTEVLSSFSFWIVKP